MTMHVIIHDVQHGACSAISTPNDKLIMIDAGHSSNPLWRPSNYYKGIPIELFINSNYDEDHLSDFPNLVQVCPIEWFNFTASPDPQRVLEVKSLNGPIGKGVKSYIDTLAVLPRAAALKDLGGVKIDHFHNLYPSDFTDTNNLSLVTFLTYAGHKFIFPGDLEEAGWEKLLKNPNFVGELAGVTVFITSHHGRENGYCSDVFKYCNPQVFVISDDVKNYETQETGQLYANKAKGVVYNGQNRYVFTTRQDGHITFSIYSDGNGSIKTSKGE